MYKYIFSFILYLLLVIFYLLSQYDSKLLMQEQSLGDSVIRSLSSAINSFGLLNDSHHNKNESKMAYIIRFASGASLKTRDEIRYTLRKEFTSFYNDRKLSNLETFHIFDKNGISVLRFHKLKKYDDVIIDKRDSLKEISTNLKAQHGFEVGKYGLPYRFQYPLFYDGEFVGSYEFGIEFAAIDREMQKIFGIKNILFIHEDEINNISTEETIKDVFKKIDIGKQKFYILKTKMKSKVANRFEKVINLDQIEKKIKHNKISFIRFSYDNTNYIAIATPISDINNKHIGFILTGVKDNISQTIMRTFIEELIFALLLGIIALLLVYKELEYRKYIRNLIDIQNDILIVTDGKKIIDANQSFLDFFEQNNLKSFIKQGDECICDYFLEEKGYIQKDMDGLSWIEYIKMHPEDLNIVLVENKNQEKRDLRVKIEGFSKSKDFVVIFNDITDELCKQHELEKKAYYDKLTNIYSRERFDYYLDKKLDQKREFSLIMFDIDHFKMVNDDYGHDVGDSVLKELTQLVLAHIRESDIFARWGGEEFMIIVNIDINKAERFANKLRRVIDSHKFKYIENVTCSFGVVGYRSFDGIETIVKRVDNMLYSAKNSGRNCVVVLN